MKETKDWNIEPPLLESYKKSGWTDDAFFKTLDGKYGVYIYNIDEWRMMSYAGLVAIFNDKTNARPILNSAATWIWFDNDNTFDYAPLSDCFIFRKPAFLEQVNIGNFPFILIKPTEKVFSFIEWDYSSIYYGFSEITENTIKVREVHSIDLENLNRPKRTDELFNLTKLDWYELQRFDTALEFYRRQERRSVHNKS